MTLKTNWLCCVPFNYDHQLNTVLSRILVLFTFLSNNGIEPVIKVRKNASLKARGYMPRKLSVIEQKQILMGGRNGIMYEERHAIEAKITFY